MSNCTVSLLHPTMVQPTLSSHQSVLNWQQLHSANFNGPQQSVLQTEDVQYTNLNNSDNEGHLSEGSSSEPTIKKLNTGRRPMTTNRKEKNKEAARKCRYKKKMYIQCLEERIRVLESQNTKLVQELKAFKELYSLCAAQQAPNRPTE